MRNLTKAASLALLAAALLVPAVPASASASASASATTVADEPFSVFDVKVKAAKTAKAGGKLNFTIVATNKGPYQADAYFVGGEFPKGVDLRRIMYRTSVKDTECGLEGRAFFCLVPKILEKGESIALIFETKLKKTATGTQTAKLGVVSYDVQTGMENMSKEELERLGIPEHGYVKTVKTKIVR
ncbi:DUF11 domain-containing protein [Nonomuraea jabiensis]|uniref:DUF11 domain-containing protein n=1 Tax=Nonomuraea jabiensis TaxID=882448 RepID=A0A7W9G378_9ACTN|nr:DUF11 domain-containing protein [Nonomuraea jabiensis]MBB5776387.1 hypothetical protein [Nonomuraea jabiensis]